MLPDAGTAMDEEIGAVAAHDVENPERQSGRSACEEARVTGEATAGSVGAVLDKAPAELLGDGTPCPASCAPTGARHRTARRGG